MSKSWCAPFLPSLVRQDLIKSEKMSSTPDVVSGAKPAQPNSVKDTFFPHLNAGRSRAAFVGVIWSSLHTLIPTLSAAGVFFVSAYYLSPADFGLLGLVGAVISIAMGFSPLAFGEALVQRKDISATHADSVFWLTTAFAVLFYGSLCLAAPFAAQHFEEPALLGLIPLLALKIPFELLAAVPNAMIVRSMKFKAIAMRTALATTTGAALSLGLLFAGFGIWALAISQVTASFIIFSLAFWVSRWRPGFSFNYGQLKTLARYGIFASGNRMLTMVKLDHIVLGALAGTSFLGLYIFSQRFFNMLSDLVTGALSSVSHTLLSNLQNDSEKTRQAFGIASFAAAAVGLPMFAGAAFVVDDLLIAAFDDKWATAAFATQGFCIVGLLASTSVIQGSLIKSQGHADLWFYYRLFQQAMTVVVVAVGYQFGMTTMVLMIIAKTYLIWPISLVLTTRILDCSIADYLAEFRGPVLATTCMAVALASLPNLLPGLAPISSIFVQIVVGILVYVPVLAAVSFAKVRLISQTVMKKGAVAK